MDWRLELVQVPVSDVDRAKTFYTDQVGFDADHDHQVSDELRFVQLTPPGSGCSIALGTGLSTMEPGSLQGLQLVVTDIHAARAELAERGVDVSDVQEFPSGAHAPEGSGRRAEPGTLFWSGPTSGPSGARSSSSATRTGTAGPCRSSPRAISR